MHQQAAENREGLSKKLTASMDAFEKETRQYKESLVSLEGDFYVHEGSNLREEISNLFLGISQYPGRPSEGQLTKTDLLEEQLGAVQAKFEAYRTQMEQLNERLAKEGRGPMKVRTLEEYLEQ